MFKFKYKYPQSFLDSLAKVFGIKWTKVTANSIPKEDIVEKPLNPPSNTLYYIEIISYKNSTDNIE